MKNILTYIEEFGSVPLCDDLNRVDALILAELAYLPFDGIVPETDRSITLRQAGDSFFKSERRVIWKNDPKLLKLAATSQRFKGIRLSRFVNEIEKDETKQFCALIFEISPRLRYIAFRGTDHSVTGWEEDFTLYSRSTLPSQERALGYFLEAADDFDGELVLGGHSKGGNLSLYVYENCPVLLKRKIRAVYNFDGPSLGKELNSEKINVFVPQSSVFGIMLTQGEGFSIVKSRNAGFTQHDVTSWELDGNDFVYLAKRSAVSRYVERAFNDFVEGLNQKEREAFIDALFRVFHNTQKGSFDDIFKNPTLIPRSFFGLDKEQRGIILETFGKVLKSAGTNIIDIRKWSNYG